MTFLDFSQISVALKKKKKHKTFSTSKRLPNHILRQPEKCCESEFNKYIILAALEKKKKWISKCLLYNPLDGTAHIQSCANAVLSRNHTATNSLDCITSVCEKNVKYTPHKKLGILNFQKLKKMYCSCHIIKVGHLSSHFLISIH